MNKDKNEKNITLNEKIKRYALEKVQLIEI